MKKVSLHYGKKALDLSVPDATVALEAQDIPALSEPQKAINESLAHPIGSPPLAKLLAERKPKTVAITISDITRPVPNKQFLPAILKVLNDGGVDDSRITIVIGTGMHRISTREERQHLLGREILDRIEVFDHNAHDASTLISICDDPPIGVCRRFIEADFRIVTGYIEAHFMAGFSGGRKGICPAMVDLATVQRFHGYETLAHPLAETGVLEGNPCHEIALHVARKVGADFLFNVAITHDKQIAGIYCGDLEAAHQAGCKQVAEWTTATYSGGFDLVITNGGGFPLDQTFYQTVKGMCTALPALSETTTLLLASHCQEKLGSEAYSELMLQWDNDWQGFLADIQAHKDVTKLDQWEYQMQTKVLRRIGLDRLWFVSDGMPQEMQKHISVHPILGEGTAQQRTQRAVDEFLAAHPNARLAVIPDGPYTMLRNISKGSLAC